MRLVLALLLVLALALPWLLRDALAERLLRARLDAWLSRAGLTGGIEVVEARVPASLSPVTVRLRRVWLADAAGAALQRAELDEVRVTLALGALFGEQVPPGPWDVEGARLDLDLRGGGAAAAPALPDVLPEARVSGLAVRVQLSDTEALTVRDGRLRLQAPPAAPAPQPLDVEALLALEGEAPRELGRLRAELGWRAGRLAVGGRLELRTPAGETLVLLPGSHVDLAAPDGLPGELRAELAGGSLHLAGRLTAAPDRRLQGEVEVVGLQLERLAAAAGTRHLLPVQLEARGRLDVPLAAADLRAFLADAGAQLEGALRRPETDDELRIAFRLAGGRLDLLRGEARTRGGSLKLAHGRLSLGEDWLDTHVELQGRADVTDLAPLGALLLPLLATAPGGLSRDGPWGGALAGEVSAAGTAREPSFQVDLAGAGLVVAGWRAARLQLEATGDRRVVRVARAELHAPGGEVVVSGELDLGARTLRDVLVDLRLRPRDPPPDPQAPPDDALMALVSHVLPALPGEIGLRARIDGPLDEPALSLESTLQDVRLTAAGRWSRPPWSAPGGPPGAVRLEALDLVRGELALALQQPAVLTLGPCPELTPVELSGSAGAASLAVLAAALPDGRVRHDVRAEADAVGLGLLPDELRPVGLLAEALEVDLRLAWTSAGATAEGGCAWRSEARDLDLRLDLRLERPALDARGLHGARLALHGELSGDPAAPTGRLEADAEELHLELPAALAEALAALQGGGEVEIDRTDVSEGELLVDAAGRVSGRAAPAPAAGLRQLGPCTLALSVACGERLELEELRLAGAGGLEVQASGSLDAPLDLLAAAHGRPALRGDAGLDLRGRMAITDVEEARAWLGDVQRLSGELQAELEVHGTAAQPHVSGRLRLRDGELRLASGIPPLEALQAELGLQGDEVRVLSCSGELGAMPFVLTGRVLLRGGDDALGLRVVGANLLVWRGQGVKLRADVDLALEGPLAAPRARGWLRLRDSLVVRSVDALMLARVVPAVTRDAVGPGLADSPLARLELDVAISAAEPVRIENNILRGALLPDLHLSGHGAAPVPEGEVQVLATRMALPATVVQITHGRLLFRAEEPGRPTIDLHGETQVRGHAVTLHASGPYDEPVLELSSSPPLPSEEALLLVLTGRPPSGAPPPGLSSGPTAVYLGQDLLARWLSDAPGDEDGLLDQFEFGYAEDVTTHGSTLVQVSYHVTGELQKGVPALFLHAEKDPYDAVNFGLRWRVKLR